MKTYLFLVAALVCCVSARAQELELDSTTGKLMYRRVVTVDSAKAGDLWERARQWVALTYKSADAVVEYESKEEGKLIGRGVWKVWPSLSNERREHVLVIECREGRARYTFTDFVTETYDATLGKMRKALEGVKMFKKTTQQGFAADAEKTGATLEKYLLEKRKGKDDGW